MPSDIPRLFDIASPALLPPGSPFAPNFLLRLMTGGASGLLGFAAYRPSAFRPPPALQTQYREHVSLESKENRHSELSASLSLVRSLAGSLARSTKAGRF
ncbi:hypothetical protein TNCV_5136211 [Trichonephila clavipes]|nr:hypothetical protein TNCV_5136211 [Trichonephila clavipes]